MSVSVIASSSIGSQAAQCGNETMLLEPGQHLKLDPVKQPHADIVGKDIQPVVRPGGTGPGLLPGIIDSQKVKLCQAVFECRLQYPGQQQVIGRIPGILRVVARLEQVLFVSIAQAIIECNSAAAHCEKIQPQPVAL